MHGGAGFHGGGAHGGPPGGGWHGGPSGRGWHGGGWHGGGPHGGPWYGGGWRGGGWYGGGWRGGVYVGVGPGWGWGPYWGGWGYPYAYPYGYPYYGGAYLAYPGAGYPPDTELIEPEAPLDDGAATASSGSWYYCPSAHGYYPDVPRCAEPWVKVAPRSSTYRSEDVR